MLSRASASGVIQGLIPNLIDGGLTHLQYADDTVIFLDFTSENLMNLRLILKCYEAISGMKINFDKNEVSLWVLVWKINKKLLEFWIANWVPFQ